MRKIDNADVARHIKAMHKINPLCTSKQVLNNGTSLQTARRLIQWRGVQIKTGLVIGCIKDNTPMLTNTGMLCLDQWMAAHPFKSVRFAEFKHIATGGIERMRAMLISHMVSMEDHCDDTLLLIVAKNPTMYDKLFSLIGGHEFVKNTANKFPNDFQTAYSTIHNSA